MNWFPYDNVIRHERVKSDEKYFLFQLESSFRSQYI